MRRRGMDGGESKGQTCLVITFLPALKVEEQKPWQALLKVFVEEGLRKHRDAKSMSAMKTELEPDWLKTLAS